MTASKASNESMNPSPPPRELTRDPQLSKGISNRSKRIPPALQQEHNVLTNIKNEMDFFDKSRVIKVEASDPNSFKIMVNSSHQNIYLAGSKGLTSLQFDAYTGNSKVKFNQKFGKMKSPDKRAVQLALKLDTDQLVIQAPYSNRIILLNSAFNEVKSIETEIEAEDGKDLSFSQT